jgi:hypothetical protein
MLYARRGLIRALDTLRLVNATIHASRADRQPSAVLESESAVRCFFSRTTMKVARLRLEQYLEGQGGMCRSLL